MSYNNHVRDTVKPPPVVDIRSYPQMPYIPGKICTKHVTTPAAQRPEFSMPSFRGPNDPLPPVSVGVPHHSSAATYEHDDGNNNDDASDGSDDRHEPKASTSNKDRASPTSVGRGPPPTSIRGPTVKHNAALPVRSPAANTFRGAPITSRGTHNNNNNSRHVVMNRQSDLPPINFNSAGPPVN